MSYKPHFTPAFAVGTVINGNVPTSRPGEISLSRLTATFHNNYSVQVTGPKAIELAPVFQNLVKTPEIDHVAAVIDAVVKAGAQTDTQISPEIAPVGFYGGDAGHLTRQF